MPGTSPVSRIASANRISSSVDPFSVCTSIGLHPALAQDATFMLVDTTLSGFIAAIMVARTTGILPAGFFGRQRRYG